MGSFFVKVGKGLLYLLVLPIFLVVITIVAIVGLFGFVYLFIKQIILFFTGRSLYADLPEDIKVKALLEPVEQPSVAQDQIQVGSPTPSAPIQQQYQQPIQTQVQGQAGQPIINVHISSDAFMGSAQPYIIEPEPQRSFQPLDEPKVEPSVQEEPKVIIPDPAPEVPENPVFQEQPIPQEQPKVEVKEKIGIYQSGDPVFSKINDDDIL